MARVRIVEYHAHLNGGEFIKVHKPAPWSEIEDAVAAVNAESLRTKVSREKTMRGRQLFNPTAMNAALRQPFTASGWRERTAGYFVLRQRPCRRTRHVHRCGLVREGTL